MKKSMYLLLLILLIQSCKKESTAIDYSGWWHCWGGPHGNFIIDQSDWDMTKLIEPSVLWQTEVGRGYASVAVVEDRVYTTGYDHKNKVDTLYCLNMLTGQEEWTCSYPAKAGEYSGTRAMPVFNENYIYTFTRDGVLYCIDRESGKIKWSVNIVEKYKARKPRWGFSSSPKIIDDMIILNANQYGIALNKNNGKKVWVSQQGTAGYATPVVFEKNNKKYAAVFSGDKLNLVDISSGKKNWEYQWVTSYDVNAADPVYFDEKLFITSNYEKGCALLDISGNEPKIIWDNKNLMSHFNNCIEYNGYIYGVSD
ncbi:MAG: PQQ-like beta-propeller repeat protein, partial [Spirochaetes bacterium]|nr:PQQ-like beta-propeller repeat protein [Spirochaetota bacterium]